jgi:hypothetical protein
MYGSLLGEKSKICMILKVLKNINILTQVQNLHNFELCLKARNLIA